MSLATTETRPPYLVVKSEPDIIETAVACWEDSENDRFQFCVYASTIVGQYSPKTQQLADRIERSLSTVQNYAKVGELWQAMNPQDAEHYRDALKYSFWPPVAALWKNKVIGMTGVKHWFDEAIEHHWTVEKLRSRLPTGEGKSVWKVSARRFMKQAQEFIDTELINSPAFDVDPKQYKKVIRALKLTTARIKKATEEQPNRARTLQQNKSRPQEEHSASMAGFGEGTYPLRV